MRLPNRSRPLLSFIRGTTFSSSGVISKQPPTSKATASVRPARSLPKHPRPRPFKHGIIRRRRAVSPRIIATDDAAIAEASASPNALVIVAPAKAIKATDKNDAELKRRVWGLALPSIGEQLLSLGVGVSDTFLSGHLSDHAIQTLGYGRATAVAAVGIASTAAWIVLTVFFGVNIGVTALVARATGARDGRLASRTVLFSLPALTLGLAVGLVRLLVDHDRIDAVVVATLATWVVWSAYLVLRATRGWTGRRAAYVALIGFALVIVVRLAIPAAHFS